MLASAPPLVSFALLLIDIFTALGLEVLSNFCNCLLIFVALMGVHFYPFGDSAFDLKKPVETIFVDFFPSLDDAEPKEVIFLLFGNLRVFLCFQLLCFFFFKVISYAF